MYNNFLYDPYRLDNAESHSLAILFHCNGSVSLLPWFIVFFCRFYLFPPRRWVQPLVGITNYTGSTLISDHIIDIYNYFIQDPYRLDCLVSYSLRIYSNTMTPYQQRYFFVFLWLFTLNGCEYSLVSLIISGVRFWAIILLLHINIYYVTLILSIFWRHIL